MRRATLLAAVFALVPVALAGCGADEAVPVSVKAPPQTAQLGWEEPYPAEAPALVFRVASFTVTRDGWSANISVENTSDIGWRVGDASLLALGRWGVMLFPDDDADELDRRNHDGSLPGIRQATRFIPALPAVLASGKTWQGTISAPGALAGGLWVRISFGPFVADGVPPKGTETPVVWFTDHAYELDEVPGQPA
jgi:hypothetical protein